VTELIVVEGQSSASGCIRGWAVAAALSGVFLLLTSPGAEASGRKPKRLDMASLRSVTTLDRSRLEKPKAEKPKSQAAKLEKPKPAVQTGPLIAVVSIGNQRVTVYDRSGQVTSSSISSGREGYETPKGVFTIIQKAKEHYSNLYNDAAMPNMQRITWSGVALHSGNLPGYRASHGCIRLPHGFSEKLYGLTRIGTRVVVASGDATPVPIVHPSLPVPLVVSTPPPAPVEDVAKAGDTVVTPIKTAAIDGRPEPMRVGLVTPAPSAASDEPAALPAPMPVAPITFRAQAAARIAAVAEAQRQIVATQRALDAAKAHVGATVRNARDASADVHAARNAKLALEQQIAAAQRAYEQARSEGEAEKADADELAAEARLPAAVAQIAAAEKAELEALKVADAAREALYQAESQRKAAGIAAREAQRNTEPVSVLISRRTGRLYVRQGFQPILDMPVSIVDAHLPLGTHVFTVMETSGDANAQAHWTVVTAVSAGGAGYVSKGRVTRGEARFSSIADSAPISRSNGSPAGVLDRIEMPAEVRERIGAFLIAGSSLIVTDEAISNETGKGTDFVVLTHQ
jgi:lipoprotein-anchoring transpeptidase ErfK/SrfK